MKKITSFTLSEIAGPIIAVGLLCSFSSVVNGQSLNLANGSFSSALTHSTTTLTQTSTTGVWLGNVTSGNWLTNVSGFEDTAVGRGGNGGQSRCLIQIIDDSAATTTGDFMFSFDYTIRDGSTLTNVDAVFDYDIWATTSATWGIFQQSADTNEITPTTGTWTNLVSGLVTLDDSIDGTFSSSVSSPFSVGADFTDYLVVFQVRGDGTVWGQGDPNWIAVDNVNIAVVPEPASYGLLLGCLALTVRLWTRRR